MKTLSSIRGFRNNNPGNIRHGDTWLGLSKPTDNDFCTFSSVEYGIRAIGRVINTYYNRHGINTVAGIISRWAPTSENDTDSYITSVCSKTGLMKNEKIDCLDDYLSIIVTAIIYHENGVQPFNDTFIKKSLEL